MMLKMQLLVLLALSNTETGGMAFVSSGESRQCTVQPAKGLECIRWPPVTDAESPQATTTVGTLHHSPPSPRHRD
ncbi:hypothetical protein LIA77_04341 [Sarocladium implicatum]|nr:hypothetical protein LIA77_04341 [Sarocladium implicatum]